MAERFLQANRLQQGGFRYQDRESVYLLCAEAITGNFGKLLSNRFRSACPD
jgi:hypothetical protein